MLYIVVVVIINDQTCDYVLGWFITNNEKCFK